MAHERDPIGGTPNPLIRLVSIAEDPADDDDTRLRRRVGVLAGFLTILAPLSLPFQAGINPLNVALAVGLSLFSLANLIVFARTHRFERYVIALISAGAIFVPLATFIGGGITGPTSGLVWGFLIPAYAILALGPQRATRWFVAYVVVVGLMVVVDPLIRERAQPPEYMALLFGHVVNAVMPVSFVFLLLRYTDVRRRIAEAQVEELLTNAIPSSIATEASTRRASDRRGVSRRPRSCSPTSSASRRGRSERHPTRWSTCSTACSRRFDALVARHGLEKIKTIGDAYMAVAGAPSRATTTPRGHRIRAGADRCGRDHARRERARTCRCGSASRADRSSPA